MVITVSNILNFFRSFFKGLNELRVIEMINVDKIVIQAENLNELNIANRFVCDSGLDSIEISLPTVVG
jgi:hypothetical protein